MTESTRRWISIVVAIVAIGFGVVAIGMPYWSLEAMPVWLVLTTMMILLWRGPVRHRAPIAVIVVIVALGLLIERHLAVALLVYGGIAYVLVRGGIFIWAFRRRDWVTVASGVAMIFIATVASYWLDLTSIVTGLAIGPILIGVGGVALWRTANRRALDDIPPVRTTAGAPGRFAAAFLIAFATLATIATGFAIDNAPVMDDFAEYDGPLGDEPGVLLRVESFDRSVPENADGYRILYTTTGLDADVVLATGLVIVPKAPVDQPLDAVLWAHGTTGVEVVCAPSLMDAPMGEDERIIPFEPLDHGWAIIAPDYLGLGASPPHPYLVGKPTAHSSLDAVRAARQLDNVSLSGQTVVWGHSQGGGNALWIGIEAPKYAPDVPLVGVAALAPASDLDQFVSELIDTPAGPIFGSYVILAYSQVYDDVFLEDYIRPGARYSQEMLVQRCLTEPSTLVSAISALIREPFTPGDIRDGELVMRLGENVPSSPMSVPVLIGQGGDDSLILPSVQQGYVDKLCEAGQVVEYHVFDGEDHISVMEPGKNSIGTVIDWTESLFNGDPMPESCSTTTS